MTDKVIPSDDIQVVEGDSAFLGSGSYAKVKLAVWRGASVAVKELHAIFFETGGCSEWESSFVAAFMSECDMLARLRHPNVVQFLGVVFQSSGLPLLVTELMRESLQERMRRSPALQTREVIAVSCDIVNALDYIHGLARPIAHRDLAPKNILLEYKPNIRAKIADLGVAKAMSTVDMPSFNTRRPGTDLYMPPEAFVNGQYTLKIDVFSLGVIMLQMAVGRAPSPSSMWQSCGDGTFRTVPERERRQKDLNAITADYPLRSIILQCLETDRPSACEIAHDIRELVAALDQNGQTHYVPAWKIDEIENASRDKVEKIEAECKETLAMCHDSLTAVIEKVEIEKEALKHENEAIQKTAQEALENLAVMTERYHQETKSLQDTLNSRTKENGELIKERDDLAKKQQEVVKNQKRIDNQLNTDFSLRLEASLLKAKADKEHALAQMREEEERKHKASLESLMADNEAAFVRTQELYEKERAEDREETAALVTKVTNLRLEVEKVTGERAALQEKFDDAVMERSEAERAKEQLGASYKVAMNLLKNQQRGALKSVKREFEFQKKKMSDDFQSMIDTLNQTHKTREEEMMTELKKAEHKISILEASLGESKRQQVTWSGKGIML
ncbi:putative mitogen-activated protein kinase kinase kinase 7-like [Corticium candelabrum]|uniref:putative mitogen-activated protein kinase kinase kinase 7-like n=1 Tax=Corticium candelabrum TaxID=121492 RepID=UPI002E275288|nr:putative mitogen-activated protein kinase kinase kinase 7-like [Corticium candelabrum]